MTLRLTTTCTLPAFRRLVVAVCTLAFLIVTMAHSLGHVEAKSSRDIAQPVTSSQLMADPTDDSSVPPSAGIVGEHCHGCTMIAVVEDAPFLAIAVTAQVFQGVRLAGINAHPPTAENPPPISLI